MFVFCMKFDIIAINKCVPVTKTTKIFRAIFEGKQVYLGWIAWGDSNMKNDRLI